ncbi:helix-turn-helix transcriptional regulator [Pseudomonas costantinii]|uniref:Autoinducer-binding protein n=1 Tax=Pseudomonas costantinii TaxID=168469 RepID=A0A1S2UTN6_9PSED|nr:LuxR C-terminal-related transcriptional regulator [Pseudomonas costantinii]OIN49814.1 autoinducer-binding protein [Pseudomonas costantinii]SED77436.1 LuxR family transcriptional regulator [Pseudomonas costantinii]
MRRDGLPDINTPLAPDDVRQLLDAELSRRGLGHFEVYQCGPTLDEAEIISNYPNALEPSDTADDFYRRGELVSLTRKRIKPFFWSDENLLVLAHEAVPVPGPCKPVGEGASFIVHGNQGFYSVLNLCSFGEEKQFRETVLANQSELQMLLVSVYDEALESRVPAEQNTVLTPRETEVLSWSSLGKTYSEVALLTSMTSHTVKFHMKNIFAKLEVSNGKSAIRKALQLGYIRHP